MTNVTVQEALKSEDVYIFDINQPFVTQEQKFKYWEESKAHIKEANKRIDALEGEVAGLRFECASKDLHTDTLLEQLEEARISNTELQANNNDLREASQALIDRWDTPKWKDAEHTAIFINALRNALSATPAESLQALKEVK